MTRPGGAHGGGTHGSPRANRAEYRHFSVHIIAEQNGMTSCAADSPTDLDCAGVTRRGLSSVGISISGGREHRRQASVAAAHDIGGRRLLEEARILRWRQSSSSTLARPSDAGKHRRPSRSLAAEAGRGYKMTG